MASAECRYCGKEFKNGQARNVHEGTCQERLKTFDQISGQPNPKPIPERPPQGQPKGPTKDDYLGTAKREPQGQGQGQGQGQAADEDYGCANCGQKVSHHQVRCSCGAELDWGGN